MNLNKFITIASLLFIISMNTALASWCGYQSSLLEPADTTRYYDSAATYIKKAGDACTASKGETRFVSRNFKGKICTIPNDQLAQILTTQATDCGKYKKSKGNDESKKDCRNVGMIVKHISDTDSATFTDKMKKAEYENGYMKLFAAHDNC